MPAPVILCSFVRAKSLSTGSANSAIRRRTGPGLRSRSAATPGLGSVRKYRCARQARSARTASKPAPDVVICAMG